MEIPTSVDEVRARYPNPEQYDGGDSGASNDYCVGGALCMMLEYTYSSFPGNRLLADVLQGHYNIDFATAMELATHITESNDAGHFEEAWLWLDKAISSGVRGQ